jgi:hypothetical protein
MKTKTGRAMKGYSIVLIAALLAGCANVAKEQGAVAKNDAVEDYIIAAELPEVDMMRTTDQLRHKVITDRYIILSDRKTNHLITFNRRCRELREFVVTPDIRHDKNRLRSRFDTYRGCAIGAMYEINAGQAKELLDLGYSADK